MEDQRADRASYAVIWLCVAAFMVWVGMVAFAPWPAQGADQPRYGQFHTHIYPYAPVTATTVDTELLPNPPTSCAWVVEWIKWEVGTVDATEYAIIQDGYTTAVTVEYIPLDAATGPFQLLLGDLVCTMDEEVNLVFSAGADTGVVQVTIAAHAEKAAL